MRKAMNLNSNPTETELAELLASCDDTAGGGHLLWVAHNGEVHISELGENEAPAQWYVNHHELVKFRLESYANGNGYVGERAAASATHVSALLRNLKWHWEQGSTGYLDY
jgi:hypothetical protein